MIVVPEYILKSGMTHLVEATHGLTDTAGEPVIIATIPESQLRTAMLVALQMLVGDVVWPGDRRLTIKRPRVTHGIFQEEG